MGPEVNIDSMRKLEKQIQQGTGNNIKLKHARNSLLVMSTRVPSEVLGSIFSWNAIPEGDFDGLQNGSYDFLFVCHHLLEVAYKTSELWYFWGNTLERWSKRCQHFGTDPLDLVLDGYHTGYVMPLSMDPHETRSGIVSHLIPYSLFAFGACALTYEPFASSSLADPHGKDVRPSSIEPMILHNLSDVSIFFARYRFPRLRKLHLTLSAGGITPP